ncbi:hypothetical protein F4777DRAFT_492292 [Nemania sp. FL0916]|nr:hypothetical protein F4777DRAFT_492292 [Nemania sp. FL0916]
MSSDRPTTLYRPVLFTPEQEEELLDLWKNSGQNKPAQTWSAAQPQPWANPNPVNAAGFAERKLSSLKPQIDARMTIIADTDQFPLMALLGQLAELAYGLRESYPVHMAMSLKLEEKPVVKIWMNQTTVDAPKVKQTILTNYTRNVFCALAAQHEYFLPPALRICYQVNYGDRADVFEYAWAGGGGGDRACHSRCFDLKALLEQFDGAYLDLGWFADQEADEENPHWLMKDLRTRADRHVWTDLEA